MSRNAKSKRLIVAAVWAGAVLVLGAMYLVLIQGQQVKLMNVRQEQADVRTDIDATEKRIKLTERVTADLRATRRNVAEYEKGMAPGGVYFWMVKTMQQFEMAYPVRFTVEAPRVESSERLPRAPYEEAVFHVTGRSTYHDFGSTLAAMENAFPLLRIQRLELEPASQARPNPEDEDKLRFSLDLSVLIRRKEGEREQNLTE